MTLLKAIEAGVDVVDTAISPMAMGASQPPTEPLVASLEHERDTELDLVKLSRNCRIFPSVERKMARIKHVWIPK